jgi:hypothetical protein
MGLTADGASELFMMDFGMVGVEAAPRWVVQLSRSTPSLSIGS